MIVLYLAQRVCEQCGGEPAPRYHRGMVSRSERACRYGKYENYWSFKVQLGLSLVSDRIMIPVFVLIASVCNSFDWIIIIHYRIKRVIKELMMST